MDSLIETEVNLIGQSLSYNGFDTTQIRDEFKKRGGSKRDLIKLLIAYTNIGNNSSNLINKVKDPKIGKQILQLIKKYGIKERVRGDDSDILTLPRLAISYSPVLFRIRKKMIDKDLIIPQFETSTKLEFQDIAFNYLENSHDYCIKFGRLICSADRSKNRSNLTDSEKDLMTEFYINLAKQNLIRDNFINKFAEDPNSFESDELIDLKEF